MAYNFSKNNQKYCEGCRTYIPFGLFISSHLNFFSFTADDAKQEDGCANDRNASKLSYSTNDLSNISPLDVNFTKDLKEPDKLNNGNVNTDNKLNSKKQTHHLGKFLCHIIRTDTLRIVRMNPMSFF